MSKFFEHTFWDKEKKGLRIVFFLLIGCCIGLVIALFNVDANAHPPCDDQPPRCGYIQVVNPITGLLEQQYICE